jgi:hemerythrin
MAFCEWDHSYSVSVPEADRQHQRLFGLINQLHESMTKTQQEATVDSAIDELDTIESVLGDLVDYTEHHFSTEETYMLEHAYPAYAAHKVAHEHFVERVRAFQRDFEQGGALCSIEIIRFLKDWLENHIRTRDKELGAFLSARIPTTGRLADDAGRPTDIATRPG